MGPICHLVAAAQAPTNHSNPVDNPMVPSLNSTDINANSTKELRKNSTIIQRLHTVDYVLLIFLLFVIILSIILYFIFQKCVTMKAAREKKRDLINGVVPNVS